MEPANDNTAGETVQPAARRLSYKFQRLRERIRAAIEAGELVGKLPGERSLARQFNVNAKTLSKALTDLAAEGVLQRNIGLGTFVRDGVEPAPALPTVLVLSDNDGITAALAGRGFVVETRGPGTGLPPSVLSRFDLVLAASEAVDDSTLRDLIVRGKPLVTVDRETRPYACHTVASHLPRAATAAASHLLRGGVRRLALVALGNDALVIQAVQHALPQADVTPVDLDALADAFHDGFDGFVCDVRASHQIDALLEANRPTVPVVGFGRLTGTPPWDGVFVTDDAVAGAVCDLVRDGLPHVPVTIWLDGTFVRRPAAPTPRS